MSGPFGMIHIRAFWDDTKTKLPEYECCMAITEFGVAEDHLSRLGVGDLLPPQTK